MGANARRSTWIALAILATTAASAAAAQAPGARTLGTVPTDVPDAGKDLCIPHGPIHLLEDEGPLGFTLGDDPVTGEPVYRPGSGVVDGSGTAEDPYVIAGWCIPAPADGAAVTLEGTSAHVVIRDNHVVGVQEDAGWGIRVLEASSVTLADNGVTNTTVGVEVVRAEDVTIDHNTVRDHRGIGVQVRHAEDVAIAGNEIVDNGDGLQLRGSGLTVEQNNIQGSDGTGLHLLDHEGPLDARNNWWGHVSGPSGGHIDACTDGGAAKGSGDQILIGPPLGGTEICFTPWLTSPNPTAGVR